MIDLSTVPDADLYGEVARRQDYYHGYTPTWDLTTIPHDRFKQEWGRRNSALASPPPRKPATCRKCGLLCDSTTAAINHCRRWGSRPRRKQACAKP